jgi:hypothetical protein
MIIVRPLIEVLGKIMKLPKNSYLNPTTLGSGTPSSSNWLRGDGTWQPVTPGPTNYGLFSQTGNSAAITATTVEGTLIDGGVGGLIIPANSFKVGDSFSAHMSGIISAKNNDTLRIRVKAGAVVLGDSGAITLPGITTKHWDLILQFTIRQIGIAGVASIVTSGQVTYSKDASNAFEGVDFSIINNTTFSTTTSNTLDITAQWSSNDPINSIYTEFFVLNKIY